MTSIVLASMSAYIMACVVATSSLFDLARRRVIAGTPWLQVPGYPHLIECRLCLSLWTSGVAVALFGLGWCMILPVYGLAYFLATQER
jgi:hypothetical protein